MFHFHCLKYIMPLSPGLEGFHWEIYCQMYWRSSICYFSLCPFYFLGPFFILKLWEFNYWISWGIICVNSAWCSINFLYLNIESFLWAWIAFIMYLNKLSVPISLSISSLRPLTLKFALLRLFSRFYVCFINFILLSFNSSCCVF